MPKGAVGNPGGKFKRKPFTDALLSFIYQPVGPKGSIGTPKKMNAAQKMMYIEVIAALRGNLEMIEKIVNRLEGRVPLSVQGGDKDSPPIKMEGERMPLPELARLIASILLRGREDKPDAD